MVCLLAVCARRLLVSRVGEWRLCALLEILSSGRFRRTCTRVRVERVYVFTTASMLVGFLTISVLVSGLYCLDIFAFICQNISIMKSYFWITILVEAMHYTFEVPMHIAMFRNLHMASNVNLVRCLDGRSGEPFAYSGESSLDSNAVSMRGGFISISVFLLFLSLEHLTKFLYRVFCISTFCVVRF